MNVHSSTNKRDNGNFNPPFDGLDICFIYFFYRERERQYEREKFWNHLENLASRSPSYEIMKMKNDVEMNNITNSPDQDDEINLDKLEQEAQEVVDFS